MIMYLVASIRTFTLKFGVKGGCCHSEGFVCVTHGNQEASTAGNLTDAVNRLLICGGEVEPN